MKHKIIIDYLEIQKNFCDVVQMILNGEINEVIVLKNNEPIVKISPFDGKSKRIGAAKNEMKNFDISLEDFNSISIPDFCKND